MTKSVMITIMNKSDNLDFLRVFIFKIISLITMMFSNKII